MSHPSPGQLTMPLEDAMRTQRSIRRLDSRPVDDDLVLHLIELAMKAPTGGNEQNWEFIIVKDPAVKQRLGRLNAAGWAIYGRITERCASAGAPTSALLRVAAPGSPDQLLPIARTARVSQRLRNLRSESNVASAISSSATDESGSTTSPVVPLLIPHVMWVDPGGRCRWPALRPPSTRPPSGRARCSARRPPGWRP